MPRPLPPAARPPLPRLLAALACAASLVAAAALTAAPAASAGPTAPAAAAAPAAAVGGDPGHGANAPLDQQGCDPLDGAQCLLPFPNDWFTKPDTTSATGRRVDIPQLAMPRNAANKPIENTDYDRADGWGVGQNMVTRVPGLESGPTGTAPNRVFPALVRSRIPTIRDIGQSTGDPNAGLVLVDAATGTRQAVWAEVDTSADITDDSQRLLIIHPAQILLHGHRYVVALRHLQRADGTPIPAAPAFAAYRDGTATDSRKDHFAAVFADLAKAGVARNDLYLAWDFTTASTANTTGRLTHIRDNAFAQLGDTNLADLTVAGSSPSYTVDTVTDTPSDTQIARTVQGHVTVPCYIAPTCTQAGQFALDPTNPDAVPGQVPGQTQSVAFTCKVPHAVYDAGGAQGRPSLYGHGLFGGQGEVGAGNVKAMAQEHAMVECGVDWYGMATADVPAALVALNDLSRFPEVVDRVQQGMLNFLYVGRALIHPRGLTAAAAFHRADGTPYLDTRRLFYDGNSQGGIYGGTLVAVAPDLDRGVLGVLGMQYSTLLPRSQDYVAKCPLTGTDPTNPTGCVGYSTAFDASYPDHGQRMVIFSLIQGLWDRADPSGYVEHLTTNPLPNTPPHQVLLHMAYGDHQVANITAESEARSIGARLVAPGLEPGRSGDVDPFFGLAPVPSYPYAGSALTVFDSGPVRPGGRGTDSPPTEDVPPRVGEDPHEAPRNTVCGRQQKSDFLQIDGRVTLPCAAPLFSFGYTGGAVAPGGSGPGQEVPEAPYAVLLLLPVLALGGIALARRRRQ